MGLNWKILPLILALILSFGCSDESPDTVEKPRNVINDNFIWLEAPRCNEGIWLDDKLNPGQVGLVFAARGWDNILAGAENAYRYSAFVLIVDQPLLKPSEGKDDMENLAIQRQNVLEYAENFSFTSCYILSSKSALEDAGELCSRIVAGGGQAVCIDYGKKLTSEAIDLGLDWCASRLNNRVPEKFSWRFSDLDCGNAWWIEAGEPVDIEKVCGFRTSRKMQSIEVIPENLNSFAVLLDDDVVDINKPVVVRIKNNVNEVEDMVVLPKVADKGISRFAIRYDEMQGWGLEEQRDIPEFQKGTSVPGGILSVFKSPLLIVYSGAEPKSLDAARRLGIYCRDTMHLANVVLLQDDNATLGDMDEKNVILIGGPEDNCVSEFVYSSFPLPEVFELTSEWKTEEENNWSYLAVYPVESYPSERMFMMCGGEPSGVVDRLLALTDGKMKSISFCDVVVWTPQLTYGGIFGGDWSVNRGKFGILPFYGK